MGHLALCLSISCSKFSNSYSKFSNAHSNAHKKIKIAYRKIAMPLEVINIAASIINISVAFAVGCSILYLYLNYLKIKIKFHKIKMNPEELLQDISQDLPQDHINPKDEKQDIKRERLSSIVAGGGSKQYLGKELQISDIDNMTPEQINKLYCRYEARLGASMTKTLGNAFINLYVMGVSRYFNVVNPPKLMEDLEEDPFINHALTSVCCELYYQYGMYLAPFTAMLTTVRHIDFSNKNKNIEFENKDIENIQNEQ